MIDRERARGNIFTGHQKVSQWLITVQSRPWSGPDRGWWSTESGREATSSPVINRSVSDSLQYSQDQDQDQAGYVDRQRAGERQHLRQSSRGQSSTCYSTVKTRIKTRREMMIDRESGGNIFTGHQEVSQRLITVQSRPRSGPGRRRWSTENEREPTSSPVIKRSVSDLLQYSQDQDQDQVGYVDRQGASERQHLHQSSRGQSATHYSTVKIKIRTRQDMLIDREWARGNIFASHQEVSQQLITVQSRPRSGPGRRWWSTESGREATPTPVIKRSVSN